MNNNFLNTFYDTSGFAPYPLKQPYNFIVYTLLMVSICYIIFYLIKKPKNKNALLVVALNIIAICFVLLTITSIFN